MTLRMCLHANKVNFVKKGEYRMPGSEAAQKLEVSTIAEMIATLDGINRLKGKGSIRYEMDAIKAFLRTPLPTIELEATG